MSHQSGNAGTSVPFADLYAQYLSIKQEIDDAIEDVIRHSSFVRGPWVERFEASFAQMIGSEHCVSCANGTDALFIAMTALGLEPGDEVIVPAMSWISTSETVTQAGGSVVFCDIDPVSFTIDPEAIEAKLTERTVGIIPVHLYGHPARMDAIMGIASSRSLWVIEDCAQAHLAEFDGRKVGTFGDVATFSFYPGKNLGAMGDAGALTTNDGSLAKLAAKFARHGGLRKGEHEIEGINSRLDGIQAAVLQAKLPHLQDWTSARSRLAEGYRAAVRFDGLETPAVASWAHHVWHLFVVQSADRKALMSALAERGVASSINYPVSLPLLPCYARLGHRPDEFPVAVKLQEQGLALPLFAEMSDEQLQHVISVLTEFFGRSGS